MRSLVRRSPQFIVRSVHVRCFSSSTAEQEGTLVSEASLFYGDRISSTTTKPLDKVLGKYCNIGNDLLDSEVPRQFERTEWSTKMDQPTLMTPEQYKIEREKVPDRGGRWDLPPIVKSDDRHILIREPAVDLCNQLAIADAKNLSFASLLTGHRGAGKTACLLHALSWARQNGWLTLYMPRASNLVTLYGALHSGTGGPIAIIPDSTVRKEWFQQPNAGKILLQTTQLLHGELLTTLPQRRKYSHDLYKARAGQTSTLAHIMMRGISQAHRAADALYDLRMEFSLVEEVPVLIAVDEMNALYWPTALHFLGRSVKAHELVLAQAFRFVHHVPGDIEDDPNPKTPRNASLNWDHLPKRGAVIGAETRSLEAPPHKEQITPARLEDVPEIKDVQKFFVPNYSVDEVSTVMAWYSMRKLVPPQNPQSLGRCRVYTAGVGEKVAQYALGSTLGL